MRDRVKFPDKNQDMRVDVGFRVNLLFYGFFDQRL